jgi:hypothetical protein
MTASGDASLPLVTAALLAAAAATPRAQLQPHADQSWTVCIDLMDKVGALQRIFKKLLTLQRRHRAYAPRRSLLARMIPLPVLWLI